MRKLFAFFMLALFVSISFEGFAQTGPWSWQQPTPQGNTIRWVKYWDANNWYAVGLAGTFMKTSNAGTSWTWTHLAGAPVGTSGQTNALYYGHFFNANTGLVFGTGSSGLGNGIHRTTNAGTTWDSTNVTPFVTGIFYFASFVNGNLGYASCTSAPYAYRTTNAGLTWEGLATTATASYDIHAFDSLNIIVATTLGNVKKSTDGGATWTTISTGASATMYRMVFADANNGYIYGGATGATGFRYTTNAGLNWTTPTNTNLPNPTTSYWDIDLKSSAVSTNKLEEGFDDVTFPPAGWSSVNVAGSVVWIRSTSQFHSGSASAYIQYQAATGGPNGDDWLITKKVNGIAAGDSLVFWWRNALSSQYPPDSLYVRVSTTDSMPASFTNLIAGLNTADTTVAPYRWKRFSYPLTAFAGQNIYVAFRHIDIDGNGGYLDDVSVGAQLPPLMSSNIYLTQNSYYVYKSTNMGTSWDTLGFLAPVASQPWTSTHYSLDIIPGSSNDDFIIGGAFGLINKRAGTTNTAFTKLVKPGAVNDVWAASSTGTVIAVGASTIAGSVNDQITRSTDGGSTWTVVPYSATSRAAFNRIQMIDNNTGWVCGTLGAVYKTTNAGLNWDSVAVDGSTSSVLFRKVDFINANTGWVFSTFSNTVTDSATIWKTTNAGLNWTKQYLLGVTGSSKGVYGADMVSATHGTLVNYTPRPYHTTDGGDTWTLDTLVDGFGGFLYDIKMFTPTFGYASGSSGRIYKTTNGTFWDTLSVPTRSYSFNGLAFISPSAGYLAGTTGVMMGTTDGGATWTQTNTYGATMNNVFITPDTKAFAVGTNGYMYKNNNILTGISGNQGAELPLKYTLEQNYPNPFNPTTTIKFALPKAGLVTLKIYDVAGREVMRLINSQNMNAGYQTQLFNGSMLSSGVYFYSLLVDNNLIATKKMVLVK
ncbi:MAG: choice-of-anchor J domain-containing protein [Candidatus Kapaibacterium sp.]